jgi:hypothetical protein
LSAAAVAFAAARASPLVIEELTLLRSTRRPDARLGDTEPVPAFAQV